MYHKKSEKGQALILIVLAVVGLIGLTALAVDGGNAYSNRQDTQNGADSAALAGALAYARGNNISLAATNSAITNGYDNDGTSNIVNVSSANSPTGTCPADGMDITVEITSHVDTYFGPVVGIDEVTNKVTATARACDSVNKPLFLGNAVVGLRPTGTDFDAHGTPKWHITGGGIFSNSSSSGSSATCGGNAGVISPSATAVGGTNFSCHTVNIGTITTGAYQYQPADYTGMLPRIPACNGTATLSGGQWQMQPGTDGSRVAFSGDMFFNPGLYCITNSPGPFHGQISGNGVTFYIMSPSFSMKFNGGGNLTAQAPTGPGEYHGVLMFSAPAFNGSGILQCPQEIDMRGNGNADIVGSVILPSAVVTMFGNSGTGGFHTQVMGCAIDTGGNADITIHYQADENYTPPSGFTITLLK
jgi:Flp pilus assembly protein TadG